GTGRATPTGWPATTSPCRHGSAWARPRRGSSTGSGGPPPPARGAPARPGAPDAAVEMARRRPGGWFEPAVADRFARVGAGVLGRLAAADVWAEVLEAEPRPVRRIPRERLDDVARAFADMVDLLTPFTLGHSAGVAQLAWEAAGLLGVPDGDLLPRAALPHPYHTARILSRSTALEPLARVAGMHHERQDGSGSHHGASGAQLPTLARLLAAADAYQAMTQDRPYRPALAPDAAAVAAVARA